MRRIAKWNNNKILGKIPKGCKYCARGSKLVLFISGICDSNCFYCPISKARRTDKIYANEQQIETIQEAINEAKMMSAEGVGITGGEPALLIERVIQYLTAFKNEFGKKFHCHLYTSQAIKRDNLDLLVSSGVDEIRFHPPCLQLEDDMKKSIKIALKYGWSVGIEIPVIPNKESEIKEIIDFAIKINLDFVNLNEFEITETNIEILNKLGYRTKSTTSVAIEGSKELAEELLNQYRRSSITIHYCSSKYKDSIQLRNRLLRRAKNFAQKYDEITEEGLIVRAKIVSDKPLTIAKIAQALKSKFKIKPRHIGILDSENILLTHWSVAEKYGRDLIKMFEDEIISIQIIHQYPYKNGIITYLDPIYERNN